MKFEVKNIKKSFDESEVLHGISFAIESGHALGLLGRNGAGKTTTIRIIMDVFKANSGEVLIDNKPFHAKHFKIGYLPEERGLYPKKKVDEQLEYLARLRGASKEHAKSQLAFWMKRLGIEEYTQRRLDTLSKGNQQKVQLAQTLMCDPDIIILDEPFSGLDPVNSQILRDVVKELIAKNKLVIFSSHQMNYVEEFCEDIVILNHGSVVLEGNLKSIKKDFGKQRLCIRSAQYDVKQLTKKCQELEKYFTVEDIKDDALIITLQAKVRRDEVYLACEKAKLDIDKFMVYEPSLTDIFVAKAGDDA